MRAALLLAVLAAGLTGCTATRASYCASDETSVADEAAAPQTLTGAWSAMLLDGSDQEEGIEFAANDTQIRMRPSCAGQSYTYAIDGNRITMTRDHYDAVCKIGLPPRALAIMAALGRVDTVQSVAAGAIRLHGGGHVILLLPREPRID